MKRSEMVELLSKYLYDKRYNFYNEEFSLYEIPNLEEISKILSIIEEAGMQPPYSGQYGEQDILNRWGQETGETEYCRVLVNKWEKEDE